MKKLFIIFIFILISSSNVFSAEKKCQGMKKLSKEFLACKTKSIKDVNRTKVIKAKVIMKPADKSNDVDKNNLVKVNEDQFIEEFLPKVVCNNSNCEVVDKQGNLKGYITNKELQKSLSKS